MIKHERETESSSIFFLKVDFEAIKTIPTFVIAGANDDISAPGQCKAALNLLKNLPKNMKRYHLQKKAGHYGIFSGKAWRSHIRPKFLEFIDNRYS